MPKFFVDSEHIDGDTAVISGGDVTHITRVLRMGEGDSLLICDGRGSDYDGIIRAAEDGRLMVELSNKRSSAAEPGVAVTLFQGLPKLAKMDYIIEKCTELGVASIVPITTVRTVVKAGVEKAGKKVERWRKIARESVKQCGRARVPEVADITPLAKTDPMLDQLDLVLIAYENEEDIHLREVLRPRGESRMVDRPRTVGVFIGPEGGLDRAEVDLLQSMGGLPVSMGKRILRTETAGHTVLTAILYEYGEL